MPITYRKQAALGFASFLLAARALAADFPVHDGDRVVFLGDSITEQRLYTTYIEAYTLARFPAMKLSFRNVGWGRDCQSLMILVTPRIIINEEEEAIFLGNIPPIPRP